MNTSSSVLMIQNLRRIVLTSVVLLFAGGSETVLADDPVNPFAGRWSGTIALAGGGVVGTIEWTISDAGRLAGTARRTADDLNFTLVGYLGRDGRIELKIDAEGGGGGSGDPWMGEAVISEGGQLVATIAAAYGRSPHFETPEIVLTLDRVP